MLAVYVLTFKVWTAQLVFIKFGTNILPVEPTKSEQYQHGGSKKIVTSER
jgi:hypothetical protein